MPVWYGQASPRPEGVPVSHTSSVHSPALRAPVSQRSLSATPAARQHTLPRRPVPGDHQPLHTTALHPRPALEGLSRDWQRLADHAQQADAWGVGGQPRPPADLPITRPQAGADLSSCGPEACSSLPHGLWPGVASRGLSRWRPRLDRAVLLTRVHASRLDRPDDGRKVRRRRPHRAGHASLGSGAGELAGSVDRMAPALGNQDPNASGYRRHQRGTR